MNAVREWSTIICLAAIVCTMLELMCPDGKTEKMVRFVLAAFLICAMISPLTGTISKISFDLNKDSVQANNSAFKKKVSETTISVASDNIKSLATQELEQHDISSKKIDVFMDTNENGSISMIKMKVYLKERQSHQDVKKILEDKLGIETEIVYGSD